MKIKLLNFYTFIKILFFSCSGHPYGGMIPYKTFSLQFEVVIVYASMLTQTMQKNILRTTGL